MAKKRGKSTTSKKVQQRESSKNKKSNKPSREQWIIAAVAAVVVVLAFAVFGSNPSAVATPDATVNALPAEINTAMGYQMFQEGAFLLDVRTQEEWEMYHVDGATMIDLQVLPAHVDEVPFDQDVIIICNSGNRSQEARDILLAAGHTSVTSIAGGIQGWMAAGHDVVSGP